MCLVILGPKQKNFEKKNCAVELHLFFTQQAESSLKEVPLYKVFCYPADIYK